MIDRNEIEAAIESDAELRREYLAGNLTVEMWRLWKEREARMLFGQVEVKGLTEILDAIKALEVQLTTAIDAVNRTNEYLAKAQVDVKIVNTLPTQADHNKVYEQ